MAIISKAELAAELGISKPRISQYVKRGMPVRSDGKLDREVAIKWVKGTRVNPSATSAGLNRAAVLSGGASANEGVTLDKERTRKLKLENDETERRLIPIEDAIAAIDAIVGPIQSELAGVAPRVSDDVAIRRKVEDEINVVCGEISKRLHKAGVDLREGRDALASGSEDNPDGVGEEE